MEETIVVVAVCCRHRILGSKLFERLMPERWQRWHWHFTRPHADFHYPDDLDAFRQWAQSRMWEVSWFPRVEVPLSEWTSLEKVDVHAYSSDEGSAPDTTP